MRQQGNLFKWQDDRGFGFIRIRDSGVEIFVHISEFPRSQRRPQLGDPLSFEIRTGEDGRKQAHAVTYDVGPRRADAPRDATVRAPQRQASTRDPQGHAPRRRHDAHARRSSVRLSTVLVAGLVLGLGAFGYGKFTEERAAANGASTDLPASATTIAPTAAPSQRPAVDAGRCDGRIHCAQMRSCADATWVLRHCPNTAMDGDGDGIPCEQQWCD